MSTCPQCRKYKAKIEQLQDELNEYQRESQDTVDRLNYTIEESSIVKQMQPQLTSARKQITELKRDKQELIKQITELKRDKQELMKNIDEAVKIAEYYQAKLQNIRTPKYNQQTQLAKERKRINDKICKLYEETRPRITYAQKIQYPRKPTSLPIASPLASIRKG